MAIELKYVIVEEGVLLFNSQITHKQAAKGCGKVYSAGFCKVGAGGDMSCYGRSDSLEINSQPKIDGEIMKDIASTFSKIRYHLKTIKSYYDIINENKDSSSRKRTL